MRITLNANIEKSKLLAILEENREKHIKQHKEALEGWYVSLAEGLKIFSERVDKRENVEISQLSKFGDKPTSFESSYDEVIAILKMTEDKIIQLSGDDFHKLVSDKWEWKQSFTSNTMKYSTSNSH